MSLQSPLARVRGLGSAKQGAHHWWMQRLTAVALILLSLWFVISVLQLGTMSYEEVRAWISDPLSTVLFLVMLVALYYHASLGVQVVIEDYVESEGRKIVALILIKFVAFFAAAVAIYSVLKVSLGI